MSVTHGCTHNVAIHRSERAAACVSAVELSRSEDMTVVGSKMQNHGSTAEFDSFRVIEVDST